jgi:hypothetical protein
MVGPNCLVAGCTRKFVLLGGYLRIAFVSSIVHNSHADLIFDLGAPLFSRGIFSRLAPLFNLVLDGLEANVLKPRSCARNDKDPTVA